MKARKVTSMLCALALSVVALAGCASGAINSAQGQAAAPAEQESTEAAAEA